MIVLVFQETGLMSHSRHGKCVEADTTLNKLLLRSCDASNAKQRWEINEVRTWK